MVPGDAKAIREAAQILDRAMETGAPFNRCFFVDEVDELGQTLDAAELIDTIAHFLVLSLASDVSTELRSKLPPHIGAGDPSGVFQVDRTQAAVLDLRRVDGVVLELGVGDGGVREVGGLDLTVLDRGGLDAVVGQRHTSVRGAAEGGEQRDQGDDHRR